MNPKWVAYIVRAGEHSFEEIDARLGYSKAMGVAWRDIWMDGWNAPIRQRRDDPERLEVGDALFLLRPAFAPPPAEPGLEWGAYTCTGDPQREYGLDYIRQRLEAKYGSSSLDYELVDGPLTSEKLYNLPANEDFREAHLAHHAPDFDRSLRITKFVPGAKLFVRVRRRPRPISYPVAPAAVTPFAAPPPVSTIVVPAPRPPQETLFTEGEQHNHAPTGRWAEVRAEPNSHYMWSGWVTETICRHSLPEGIFVLSFAELGKPDETLQARHLWWYFQGGGRDFIEDENIAQMLLRDKGVRGKVAQMIRSHTRRGTWQTHFFLDQSEYDLEEFQYSFGAIDRVDMLVDYDADTVHVWFKDRYEWHPYYPGIYEVKRGDENRRSTNCVHAAMVEMKAHGAADYWMKGEATLPLAVLLSLDSFSR